jgi:hypothetical protein
MKQPATGKRYAELPGVTLRLEVIPPPLIPLLEDAKKWAIVGETGIERAISKASLEDMEALVARAKPLEEKAWKFAHESIGSRQIPIPDEVVLFQIFLGVLRTIDSTVRLKKSRIGSSGGLPLPAPMPSYYKRLRGGRGPRR